MRPPHPLAALCAVAMTLPFALPADPAHAQLPRQPAPGEIQKRLQKLSVLGSVLYVAAHPDDENTSLLTYLANGRMVRTAYLSMTRGDGGQNLIGAEQGVALGIIRTQELLAARRIDGAQQLFTRARDFGFSKSVDESLRWWGEEDILADTVVAIRRFQPDVIVTRFSASGGGHGHHTASARLAARAFKAAADPSYKPAGVPDLPPWQARRLLWNRGGGGGPAGDDLRLDVGGYDPLLGTSYGELSAESRSMHKSQGFGQQRRRGPNIESFQVTAEAGGGKLSGGDPFQGIDWSWRRVRGSERAAKLAAELVRNFRPADPAASLPGLVALDAALDGLADPSWKAHKRAEVAALIAACAGLWIEATADAPGVVPGRSVKVNVTALNRGAVSTPVQLVEVQLEGPALADKTIAVGQGIPLPHHRPQTIEHEVKAAPTALPSGPYWLRQPPLPGRFQLADGRLTNTPENAPALSAVARIEVGGRRFALSYPVIHKWTDPVAGERFRPLEVVPAVSVRPQTRALLFPDGKAQPLTVRLKAAAASTAGTLQIEASEGFTVKPPGAPFTLAAAGDEVELRFAVTPPRTRPDQPGTLRAIAEVTASGGAPAARLTSQVDVIEHPHIPMQMMLTPADVRLQPVALKRDGRRIGYIEGAGDEVARSLEQVGYQVVLLDEAALASTPLTGFDAIVTGVRAFNTNDRLGYHHPRLMEYVKAGGTLVVQYNTSNRLSKLQGRIGPLPFDIGRDRVTDETAAVTFEQPSHRVLSYPNRITPADFEGWVQERGLYFAQSWDKGYEAPLSMADPGDPPQKGSLIVTHHGKGAFVYTGLAFFRQLPAGVPGAYRLFANLVAHGKASRR
jgi:LmbE family N-acetylglucosaminyl deacetylase